MEQKFLQYLLFITLVELREKAIADNDARTFWLCDVLHNVPAALASESECKEEYARRVTQVKNSKVESWLQAREKEFFLRFPEFAPK